MSKKRRVEDIYPLSPMQEGMLFHCLQEPHSGIYFEQVACTLAGELEVEVLERAWQRVVDRHPSLRTAFVWERRDEPFQVVFNELQLPWEHHDWRTVAEKEQGERFHELIATDRRRGFELSKPPLMRLILVHIAPGTWRLLWSCHHLLIDGWSQNQILGEVFACYQAFSSGDEPRLGPSVSYGHYIAWLRRQDMSRAESFWRQELHGFTSPISWAPERPSVPTREDFFAGERELRLSRASTARLQERVHRERLTANTFVQAAWALLVGQFGGTDDVIFGVTVAGRPAGLAGVDTMTGLFVNTLPLRVNLAWQEGVLPWLAQLRERQAEIGQYEYTPLAHVQRWSEVPPGQALFDNILVFENYPMDEALLDWGPRLAIRDIDHLGKTNYSLTAIAHPGEQLALKIVFDRQRFERTAVERLLRHWRTLLESLVEDPSRRLGELPRLSASERQQVAVEWSLGDGDSPEIGLVHQLFEQRAARCPEAPAVIHGEQRLNYRELNERADRIAHRLRDLGVGPESLVAICSERSAEMVAGILGVWKAGGAYVPLEPEHPAKRLAAVLAEVAPAALLTQERLISRFPSPADIPIMLLDVDTGPPAIDGSVENPPRAVEPWNLAYVIYTSGSTGKPKGVLLHHHGLCHLQAAQRGLLGVRGDDRVLQFASLAFDASISEICMTLISGAALVMAPREILASPDDLARLIDQAGVTVATFPPTLLGTLSPRLDSLRLLLSAGESCSTELVARWGRGRAFWNAYGPTEVTVCSTMGRCDPADRRPPSIGTPIANARVYLLGSELSPVSIGQLAELYLAGEGVARGYLGRPGTSAESFLPDPFDPRPGRRMYRSGDLARRRADGCLIFAGRRDHQVKVRGYRIELGEIEAALSEHQAVRQAVVSARDDGAGQRLVAYLVAADESPPGVGDLRAFLARRLPDYMVPALFVMLAEVPLTSSGKVDRKALPAPERLRSDLETAFVAPRTPTEVRLATIWCEVLGLEKVGVEDDFFALGGDSIISIRVVSKARQRGIMVTPKQAFEHPTVAALAAVAESLAPDGGEHRAATGEAPLTPIQRWFFDQRFEAPEHWNQAILLRPRLAVGVAVLARAFDHLVKHHDALRLGFTPHDGGIRQRHNPPPETAPFFRVDLRAVSDETAPGVLAAVLDQAQTGFDLARGPLVRAIWVDLAADPPGRLALVAHHLIVDVVSWRILLDDLETACTQLRDRRSVRLTARTSSFKVWGERLVAWAATDAAQAQASLWQAPREVARLPLDFPDGANRQRSARTVTQALTSEETRALLREVPSAYRTRIDEVLLAALAQTLRRWIGGPAWIDLEGHGREALFDDIDLSSTVGWFTNVYPVRLDVTPGADAGQTLKSVKEQLRRIPWNGLGYGVLRYLTADNALVTRPTVEISFNYLGQLDEALPETGLFELAPEPAGAVRSLRGVRSHRLEVSGSVRDGRLEMEWTYSDSLHRRETVEGLARGFLQDLRGLIAHCRADEVFGYTPSDFPLASVDQEALDRLLVDQPQVEDLYPLAPIQQGLLFHSLSEPTLGEYVVQFTCRFDRPLDAGRFRQAWEQAVAHQPVLRTAFLWQGLTVPLQVVQAAVELPWQELDWREVPPSEQPRQLARWLEEDRRKGFDLRRAPLLRLTLLRLTDEVQQFVWTLHHLLMDGWSLSLLLKDVFAYYEAPSALTTPSRPYRDYIAWLEGQDLASAEAFWRGLLDGFTTPTPVGLERTDGEALPRELEGTLPAAVTTDLETVARRHQLTLNTLVLGAWGLLLGHLSGKRDVVCGATVSGRSPQLEGIESIVGLFINTLPARLRLPASQASLPWLEDLQQQQLEMRQFEYSPLTSVQKWSQVPAGQELFHSSMVFENYPIDAAVYEAAESLASREARSIERTHYPLNLIAVPGRELQLRIGYDGRRFDRLAVWRMMGQLKRLLGSLLSGVRLGELPWLSASERQQLIVEWNDTRVELPPQPSIHTLFEVQASRTPAAPAVLAASEVLSYGELDVRANRLAHHLRRLGVGPDDRVGIYLERSAAMLVAALAALKADGAYVPLDPSYPRERLDFMAADAGISVLVEATDSPAQLSAGAIPRVGLDTGGRVENGDTLPESSPPTTVGRHHLAYVMYTSGSTGLPKGVEVPHAGVLRLVWEADYATLDHRRTLLHGAPMAFDASTLEVWGALLRGGRCVLMPSGIPTASSLRSVVEEGVDTAWLTASLFNAVVDEDAEALRGLRQLLIGGEALSVPHVSKYRERFPDTALINGYGPTESTTFTCCHPIPARLDPSSSIPIGRPIVNTRVYILDQDLQPVALGVEGEAWIGGLGLARGYLRRAALTAESFIPDLWNAEPGTRLYRTGDLVRWRAPGQIEFLGRADQQVKVRGHRIELGEIEVVLKTHPAIAESVVVMREERPGRKRLVGYLTTVGDEIPATSDLRDFLEQRLPTYMLPAIFMTLTELPLTASGKVDRRALPVPEVARPELTAERGAPQTPKEECLGEIWADILKLERVGRDDNFFELGGDSILSIQVVARAEEAGLRLTPKQLFENPTLSELAAVADVVHGRRSEQGPVTGEVPLTPVQHWFLDLGLPHPEHFNMALLFTVDPRLDAGVLRSAARPVAAHHDALRLRFSRRGSEGWRQEHTPSETLTLVEVDLEGLATEARTAAITTTAERQQRSFDLERGPLMRMIWFRFSTGEPGRLLILVHHLVMDVVSWRILLQDLTTACEQLRQGETVVLPPKSTSFQRWARRLTEHAHSAALESEVEHWAAPARHWVDPLPIDMPDGANLEASSRTVVVTLEQDETAALVKEAHRSYRMRVDEVLLTALTWALQEWTGSGSALIDVESHGREDLFEDVDLSRTVGWFTTFTPVLLEVPDGGNGEGAALKAVKEELRRVPHRGFGHGLLRYLSEHATRLRELPTPEVSFNYLGQLDQGGSESSLFVPTSEAVGAGRDPQAPRTHTLEINCSIASGQLRFELTYSTALHDPATAENLAQRCHQHLKALIEHLRSVEADGFTPSDFPLLEVNQEKLDKVVARFSKKGK